MPLAKHKESGAVPTTLRVPLLEGVVMAYHALTFPEKDLDPDRSPEELVKALDRSAFGRVKTEIIECALYYCNLMDEEGKFWHPQRKSFEEFVGVLLPTDLAFNRFYNLIVPRTNRKFAVEQGDE